MPTITPPPIPPPGPPPTAPRSLPSVIVSNPPAALTKLPTGAQFEGTISTAASRTTVQVTTQYGTLQVQTTLPLEPGARLSLILQNLVPEARLQVASINGRPPHLVLRGADIAQAASATGGAGTQAQAAVSGPATSQGLIGTHVLATMLRPGGPARPLGTASPSPGNRLSKTGAVPPGQRAAPTAGGQAPASPPGGAKGGPMRAGGTPGVAAAPVAPVHGLQQGTQVPLRVLSIQPPPSGVQVSATSPALGAAPPAIGQTVTAIVSGSTAQGQPIVRTPLGPMVLSTTAPLAAGSEIKFEIAGKAQPPEAGRPDPAPAKPLALFNGRQWPSLKEAIETMQAADPAALQHLAARALPQASPQFTASLLFFLSALRGGDVSGWLGDDMMRILQRARPNLTARLIDEFQSLGGMSREPMIGDWRLALIPFLNGPDLEPLRLYLKPYGEEEEDESKGVRFIIDVDLSRLGRIQLDGLVRDEQKRLDLIIRSETPMDAGMRNDIRVIFEDANEATGIKGGLAFQSSPPGFMEVAPEERAGQGSDIVA